MKNLLRPFNMTCAGCNKRITSTFYLTVLDKNWHNDCVRCADCNQTLDHKCFFKENKILCKDDFYRRYSPKCDGCLNAMLPGEMFRPLGNRSFHMKCCVCCVCHKELATAEEVHPVDQGKYVCKDDFLSGKYADMYPMSEYDDMDTMEPGDATLRSPLSDVATSIHQNPHTPGTPKTPSLVTSDSEKLGVSIKEEDCNSDYDIEGEKDDDKKDDDKSGNKRRGPRTTIKAKQLDVLKNAFSKTPKPTRHLREQLAKETSLPMRVIQVWFQNKRSKERRMKQLSTLGMRAAHLTYPRKMRDHPGMEDAYYFNNYAPGFPHQQFPSYFGPQTLGYPQMCPGMEQPLPPGGPMTNVDFPQLAMSNLISEQFPVHQPMNSSEDMGNSVGSGNFSDHTSSEILAW